MINTISVATRGLLPTGLNSLVISTNGLIRVNSSATATIGSFNFISEFAVTAKGSSNATVSSLNSNFGVTANATASANVNLLAKNLTSNFNVFAQSSAIAELSEFNVNSNFVISAYVNVTAIYNSFDLSFNLPTIKAFERDISNNEIVLLNSYITNKIIRKSTITNKLQWERYIKVKLTLQSKLR